MGEDLSAIARIVMSIIVVCAIVVITFTLVRTLRGAANTSSKKLVSSMTQLLNSEYDSYNNQPVTGRDVVAAIQMYAKTGDVILVTTGNGYTFNYGALLEGSSKYTGSTITHNSADGDIYIANIDGVTDTRCGISINCRRNSTNGISDGYYTATLSNTNGASRFNTNTKPTTRSGLDPYIRESADFYAELIYDLTGELRGISFIQQ